MKTLKEIKSAFEVLDQCFYSANRNYARALFELSKAEEKAHRGSLPEFTRCHTSDTASPADMARLFAVKRVAEYILTGKYPKGQDYLHTQTSCFIAAGIADEFGAVISKAWGAAGILLADLANLDYVDYVKVRSAVNANN